MQLKREANISKSTTLYFENDNTEGAIIFLDFHKAFDTVNHTFLHLVLEKFNFGTHSLNWLKLCIVRRNPVYQIMVGRPDLSKFNVVYDRAAP